MPLTVCWGRIRHIVILFLFTLISPSLFAQITLESGILLTVETPSLHVKFLTGSIISLQNKTTGEEYVAQPGPNWVVANMMNFPGAQQLEPGFWEMTADITGQPAAKLIFSDGTRVVELWVTIDPHTGEMVMKISAGSSLPGMISAQWGVFGLDLDRGKLVIPGQAGVYFDRSSDLNIVGLDYPTHWESQFVVYEAEKGSLLVYANDLDNKFKRVSASRFNGNLDVGFEVFAVAPWENATDVPNLELRFKGFWGKWREPAAYYKNWWHQAREQHVSDRLHLRAAQQPEWVKKIRAVITIRYMDMQVLDELSSRLDASQTLLYIVPWRRDGFDLNYPDYTPSDDAKQFIDHAHALGFYVMLHTNILGVSQANNNYSSVQYAQMRTPDTKESVGWLWDLPEGDHRRIAYINPASGVYRQIFIDSIRPMIEQLHPDAIHLDAGGAIQNDGNGLIEGMNSLEGVIQLLGEIQLTFPGIVLGYESITETLSPYIQFAQRWRSDYPSHPIGAFFFDDLTRSYGFLDQPVPDEEEYISYLRRYEGQGVIPTIPVSGREDFDDSQFRVSQLLNQLKLWQLHQFEADWQSDWGNDVFRFKSQDGEHQAVIQETEQERRLLIDDTIIYRRIKNATSIDVGNSHIRFWPAYQGGRVIGLNPEMEYWLDEGSIEDPQQPHLVSVPDSVHLTNSSFVNQNFAILDFNTNAQPSFDFIGSFGQSRKGTFYRGFGDFPLVNGATAATSSVVVGQETRESVLVMHPPYQRILGGVTFVEYTVKVPDAHSIFLEMEVALADSSRTAPAVFAVWINGEELWRAYYTVGEWHHQTLDLNRWRGQEIQLRLIGGPSVNGNPKDALTCWSNVKVIASKDQPGTSLQIHFPKGQPFGSLTGLSSVGESESYVYETKVDIPGRLIAFVTPPSSAHIGVDLVDLPFQSFRSTFDGMPTPYSSPENAIVRPGVVKGEFIPRALYLQPPPDGRVYASWSLSLPPDTAALTFRYGFLDPLPGWDPSSIVYSGATFHVLVNGVEVFQAYSQQPEHKAALIDLSQWAGSSIILQVAVDADGTAIFDWGYFSDLKIQNQ